MDIKITIPDKKENEESLKRMDSLEKKIDQHYKDIVDKKDFVKTISLLQKSFLSSLNKLILSNRSIVEGIRDDRMDSIKRDFNLQIKRIEKTKDGQVLKDFSKEINKLEDAIKKISINPSVKVIRVNNGTNKLDASFALYFKRLEDAIRQNRPRLIPSPS